jgi:UDP-glucose 6-dehydrogenase
MKKKIAIVGHGFVGKAVDYGFSNPWLEKIIVDPKYNAGIDKLTNVDLEATFICVPTPMNADGSINSKIVVDTVNFIKEAIASGATRNPIYDHLQIYHDLKNHLDHNVQPQNV